MAPCSLEVRERLPQVEAFPVKKAMSSPSPLAGGVLPKGAGPGRMGCLERDSIQWSEKVDP